MTHIFINKNQRLDEEKKTIEDAKTKAMSNERRTITELFKGFKFESTEMDNVKK